jgi:predicted ATPase
LRLTNAPTISVMRAIHVDRYQVESALATRFGQDAGVSILCYRGLALFLLGYPDAALADVERSLKDAREIGQAPSLMYALYHASFTHIVCRNYAIADSITDELVSLASEKNAMYWKANGTLLRSLFAPTGKALSAIETIISGVAAYRSTGATMQLIYFAFLARAHAELTQFDEAWSCISEAMTAVVTTKETWFEAEVNRVAGEIALNSPKSDAAKAEAYFERALAVARTQQAKSLELRAATSLARLWRDQGKPQQARELLAPVYGWFTEGFDTLDLKESKALLDELHA